jgi:hypothetical protein
MLEVLDSNLGKKIGCPDLGFLGFPQILRTNSGLLPECCLQLQCP